MYTEPRITKSKNGVWAVYFSFTFSSGEKKYYRISEGKKFGLAGRGNGNGVSLTYKQQYFSELRNIVSKQLKQGWVPGQESDDIPYKEAVEKVRDIISRDQINDRYKRNLIKLLEKMYEATKADFTYSTEITQQKINHFLRTYSTGAYFNNQKAHLGAILSRMVAFGLIGKNPVTGIKPQKSDPGSNLAFTKDQVNELLKRLKAYNRNLYLCVLLMYRTLLRPHQEIRLLKRGYFSKDLSVLTIPEGYTKNGKGRVIPVGGFLRDELIFFGIDQLSEEELVFSKHGKLYAEDYFYTMWRKFAIKNRDIVGKNHTLYSFRHSAAIEIFNKTKSLQKVKLAMDHSSLAVTLKYLRSLNIFEAEILEEDLPEIEGL